MSLIIRAITWITLGPPTPDAQNPDAQTLDAQTAGGSGDTLVRDRGQATTEYALVMLAAALVALLVVAWATAGGGAGKIGRLFDRILDEVISRV